MHRPRDYLSIFVVAPAVALVALAISLVHTYNEAQALARSQLGEQQLQLARQSVVSFGKNIDLLVRELEWLARRPAAIDFDLDAFRTIAEESFGYVKRSYVNDVALIDAGGIVRLPLEAPYLTGRDFSYRGYFKKAAASGRKSPIYELITFKGVDAGERGIAIAMPILSDTGEFRGVVLFTIIVAELIRGLGAADPTGSRSWVMDSRGNAVFHPAYPTGTRLTDLGDAGDSYRKFLGTALLGRSGKAVYSSPEGTETIAAYYPIVLANEMCSYVVAADEDVARGLLASFTADYAVLTTAAFLVVLAGTAAVLWRINKWHRDLESTVSERTEDLERYQRQLQTLAAEWFKTEGRERRRIAAELHDRIGQSLAMVSFRLAALRRMVAAEHAGKLGEARSLLKQTIEDTRSLTFELSPPILYELGLGAAVRWLAEEVGEQHGITFEVATNGRAEPLAADLSDLLFQAVRELLINVVKHSEAESARIDLERVDDNLRITVEDDGAGFDPAFEARRGREGGFGLFSIRERLAYSGGRLEIASRPGCGTRATLVAPLGFPPTEAKGET